MDENKKPRLCELLGVEVGEEWTVEDGSAVYSIDEDGELLYQSSDGSWLCAYGRAWVLISVLNGKAKITRRSRWTETDVAHARALRKLCPDAEAVEKIGPCNVKIITMTSSTDAYDTYIRAKLFPSLASGESARLDEILEAAP